MRLIGITVLTAATPSLSGSKQLVETSPELSVSPIVIVTGHYAQNPLQGVLPDGSDPIRQYGVQGQVFSYQKSSRAPQSYEKSSILSLCKLHRCATLRVIVSHVVDPRAHRIAPHQPGIVRLQQFGRRSTSVMPGSSHKS